VIQKPQIAHQRSPSLDRMVKPEVRNHNKRKLRLGFDTFIKEDVDIISRHTDYFSKPQSRSNSRGSKRK
jgi:hypothetical protein